ncbi:MAG TPA: type II CAAX endopeptidase family protein [Bacillota bacterium]|nr:type II CAAX endopeptidase family protein [Bacillota bacterium]
MFKNRSGQVRAGWIIMMAFIVVIVVQTVFQVPGSLLLAAVATPENPDVLVRHPWMFLLMQGGGTAGGIVMTIVLWRFLNKKSVRALGFGGRFNDFWFGMLLGAVSIVFIFLLLVATGNVTLINSLTDPEFTVLTFTFFIIFILVAFFEEMFFRGYVMRTMANRGNKKWLIYVGSALFFSVVHGTNPNVTVLGLVNIMLVGLLFAYMFDMTQSLWLPIGYHITWNYFQGNVFGFPVSGTTPHGIYEVDVSIGNDWLTGGAFGLEGGIGATVLILIGFGVTKWYVKQTHALL